MDGVELEEIGCSCFLLVEEGFRMEVDWEVLGIAEACLPEVLLDFLSGVELLTVTLARASDSLVSNWADCWAKASLTAPLTIVDKSLRLMSRLMLGSG